MSKDVKESKIATDFAAKCEALKMKNPADVLVGNNGYAVGQEFHATGALKIVESKIGDRTACYVAVETEEGVNLSIKSLMNISSLQGYHTEGTFVHQTMGKDKQIVDTQVSAEVVPDFSFDDVFKPTTRNLAEFIAQADTEQLFAGKTIRYLGNVVRPYKAKNDSPRDSFETWKTGYERTINQKLWEIR